MQRRTLHMLVACFVGGSVTALGLRIAAAELSLAWIIGVTVLGALMGYLAYDSRAIVTFVTNEQMWRDLYEQPLKLLSTFWLAAYYSVLYVCTKPFWDMAPPTSPTAKHLDQALFVVLVMLTAALMHALTQSIAAGKARKNPDYRPCAEFSPMGGTLNLRARMSWTTGVKLYHAAVLESVGWATGSIIFVGAAYGAIYGFFHLMTHKPMEMAAVGASAAIVLVVRFGTPWLWRLIKYVHSDARVVCAIDGVIGGWIGFLASNQFFPNWDKTGHLVAAILGGVTAAALGALTAWAFQRSERRAPESQQA